MIRVDVRYHNILHHHAGVQVETLVLPDDAALLDALEHIAQKHGPHLQGMLFAQRGLIASHLVVFANGKLLHDDREEHRLSDGDHLMLFPATSGG